LVTQSLRNPLMLEDGVLLLPTISHAR